MAANGDLLRDDRPLRDAFRRGDRAAMAAVYDAYLPLVRAVVTHGFGAGFRGFFDPIERAEGSQNIFLAAFEERARLRYDGVQPYSAFLRGIAHNVVRDMLRKQKRFERGEPERIEDVSTEDAYLARETAAVLRRFADGLQEPADRAILRRYFVDGASEEALAVELALTRYRLRKRIAGLQKTMKKYLKHHGIHRAG